MQRNFSATNQQSGRKSFIPISNSKKRLNFFNSIIQPKLTINPSNDAYEQQADAMAEKVMRMPANENHFFKPTTYPVQRKCDHCEQEEKLQMKGESNAGRGITAPSVVHDVINSSGQPLDAGLRDFFEPKFGTDFSNVQIHNDALAHQSSKDINALAYTQGQHTVFGNGQYQPGTNAGKQLLAHELTHVVQQKNSKKSVQRKPFFNKQCTEYQRCHVIEAISPAKQLVDNAIKIITPVASGKITSGTVVNNLNMHFKAGAVADAPKILDNYMQIKAELDNTVQYNCFEQDPGECISAIGKVGGATDFSKGAAIDLCAYFFIMNCTEEARELVHENAHHLGFTNDYAYADQAKYQTIPHEQAMQNPDTYAQFAKISFPGDPSCKDCSFQIQVKKTKY